VKLRHINTLLLVCIIGINGAIITLPFVPSLVFWAQSRDPGRVSQLEAKITAAAKDTTQQKTTATEDNRLIIPRMMLDEAIHTGPTARTLRDGLWLRPQGDTPDNASNTVIVGHRFTYTDPQGTFYHLDKVRLGDRIAVWWEGKQHTYTVSDIKTVQADQTSIEAPTKHGQLTLYTCTPLWLPKDRLVVIATEDMP